MIVVVVLAVLANFLFILAKNVALLFGCSNWDSEQQLDILRQRWQAKRTKLDMWHANHSTHTEVKQKKIRKRKMTFQNTQTEGKRLSYESLHQSVFGECQLKNV